MSDPRIHWLGILVAIASAEEVRRAERDTRAFRERFERQRMQRYVESGEPLFGASTRGNA